MSADKKSDFESLLASELRAATLKNISEAGKSLSEKEPWIMKKIRSAASRYYMDESKIVKAAKSHEYALATLSKRPNAQNFYENFVRAYIGNIRGVHKLEKPDSLFIQDNGTILSKESYKDSGGQVPESTKSIDFTWQYNEVRIYAAHKYTGESGGMQDNQRSELERFIKNANNFSGSYQGARTFLLALCDGPYYDQPRARGESRLVKMQSLCQGAAVWALPSWELEDWLREKFGEPESSE
ncbi:MAG: hypothetical protein MPK06_02040 [Alphaproteobacteria bacterium]|nr:hypothetical protein [Alphaproteobacteria bacterium]MDA8003358.1 hypothetical protein [Alphaproteobacteria bacterium]MDA8005308.1 hypothetical protein [Alphaproteobacteria bacterium]